MIILANDNNFIIIQFGQFLGFFRNAYILYLADLIDIFSEGAFDMSPSPLLHLGKRRPCGNVY